MNQVEAHLIAAAGDPYKAARVSCFMDQQCPMTSASERWKVVAFEVEERHAQANELRAALSAARHGGLESQANRWVREGRYVSLKRKRDWRQYFQEIEQASGGKPLNKRQRKLAMNILPHYLPMMSDTPNEIEDHDDPIQNAGGRMLIHGLGLGCIVAALHVIPEVEHIDVVEYDPEVIALTGRYYASLPKVSIVRGNALTHKWSKGAHWDYVWHDIWERISTDNLEPENAEYGISYQMLFDRFESRAERQGAWAYERALEMQTVEEVQEQEAHDLMDAWPSMGLDERTNLILQGKLGLPGLGGVEPARFRDALDEMPEAQAAPWREIVKQCEEAAKRNSLRIHEALMIKGYLSLDDLV